MLWARLPSLIQGILNSRDNSNPMFTMFATAFNLLADYTESYAWFPEAASSFAETNDWLYKSISYICIAFFIPITICLFGFTIRYHKAKGGQAESNAAHNTPLELAWSILPSFVLVWMFYQGAVAFLDIRTVPDGANKISVTAQKWNWLFDYGGGVLHPELHILNGEATELLMQSNDVIHSLYVPAFRAKKDIVPGRYNHMWFRPTVANAKVSAEELAKKTELYKGQTWDYDATQFTPDGYEFYDLYCAEYCGKDHSIMQTVVVVHDSREDLDAWLAKAGVRPESTNKDEWGRKLYEQRGCMGCHSLDGTSRVGPSYKDQFGTTRDLVSGDSVNVDENYIRESILNPKAKVAKGFSPVMPSYKGQFSDDDIDSIIAYYKTLTAGASAAPATPPEAADQTEATE